MKIFKILRSLFSKTVDIDDIDKEIERKAVTLGYELHPDIDTYSMPPKHNCIKDFDSRHNVTIQDIRQEADLPFAFRDRSIYHDTEAIAMGAMHYSRKYLKGSSYGYN